MKQKRFLLVVFLIVIVSSGSFFLVTNFIGKHDSTKQNKGEDNKNDWNEKEKLDAEGTLENKSISFSNYKTLYKNSKLGTSANYFNQYINEHFCKETNKGALIEFIFLKRNSQGKLQPYPIKRLLLKKRDTEACGDSIIHNTLDKYPRFLHMVTTDCVECGAGPGTLYEVRRLGDHNNLHYPVRIPKKNKLVFQEHFDELTGTRDDKVYRIPLMVNEILKTKEDEEEEEGTKYSFTVQGIEKKVSKAMKVELVYRKNGEDIGYDYSVQDGKATFVVFGQNKEDVLNGNLYAYQRFDKEQIREHDIPKQERSPEKLLQHKRNVQSFTVNLSSNLEFDHRKKKWIQKTISVEPFLEQIRKRKGWKKGHELMEDLRRTVVTLNDPQMGDVKIDNSTSPIYRKKPPEISSSFSTMMDGEIKSPLTAPPGNYNLYIGPYKVVDHYKWPPKD